MKKTIISLAAICSIGLCVLAGCDSSSVGSGFAISNKNELQEEWHVNDSTRTVTFTCDDEEFNASALISSGDIVIESSAPEVVGVVGSLLYPLGEGTATISATYGKSKDSVAITVEAAPSIPYKLGKEYYLAEDANNLTYYFTGNQVGNYSYEGEMSNDPDDAVAVTLSEADGDDAYYMTYSKEGTTYYICIIEVGGYQDLQLVTEPTPIYYYASNDAWVNADATYYLGWHSTYNCLYASSISGINTYQHAYLIDPADVGEVEFTYETPVTEVSENTDYYLGIVLGNVQYYFNGSIQKDFYLDVTTDVSSAATVKLTSSNDSTENGYNITFTKNGTTQIFYAYYDGIHYTAIFATEGNIPSTGSTTSSGNTISDVTTTFVWDSTICGFTVTLSSTKCTLGLGSTSTYKEITLVTGNSVTAAQLYAVEAAEEA